ncbi:hypothetical protein B0H16DRAFT_1220937, partial [Mycena metata]
RSYELLQKLIGTLTTMDTVSAPMAGLSVEDTFEAHLISLAGRAASPSSGSGSDIASLYSVLKTFWLPSCSDYLGFTASGNQSVTTHRFFFWDPQPLVFNGVACAVCTAPLTNRGRITSGALGVYDLTGPFYIIGCVYACTNDHVHASTDESVRRALPQSLQGEFPALLLDNDRCVTRDGWSSELRGVSRAVWNLVQGGLRAGLEVDIILRVVRAV